MIAALKGTIDLIDSPNIIIDVHGVGYKVVVSRDVLAKAKSGDNIKIFTYTHVREDALDLYGFLTLEGLKLFEHLISVSGVGPKTALSIFSINTSSDIIQAIISGNVDFFSGVPRLGKKNAQKIIIELRSKFSQGGKFEALNGESAETTEVFTALKSFGFSTREIQEALRNIDSHAETSEQKIKLALKYLGK